jgi:hypothetical protein
MRMPFKKPFKCTVLRQLGGIGDLLMVSPVFRGLKEKYGKDIHLTVATSWDYQAGCLPQLLRHNPFVDQIVRVEPHEFATGWMKACKWEFKNVVNAHIPDCVLHTDLVIELSVICAMTETQEMNSPGNVQTHRTDIWCKAAGVEPSSKKPILCLTDQEMAIGKAWCDENLGEGIRIGMPLRTMAGTCIGHDVRGWPHTEAFAFDLKRAGYKVVTIDSMNRIHESIPALLGKPIRFVAAVIAHLDAVVTPDTGILHVAGAVGTPILGLFGSTNGDLRMREYCGSYSLGNRLVPCAPCWYRTPCLQEKDVSEHVVCMKRISRDLVMHELEVLLDRFGMQLPRAVAA